MTREQTSQAIYADTSTGMRSISDSDLHDAIRYVGPGWCPIRRAALVAQYRERLEQRKAVAK